MKTIISYLTLIIILISITSCKDNKQPNNKSIQKSKFALVVHGGAGSITKGKYSIEKENEYKNKLEEALKVGYEILNANGSSVDAVESVIRVLEDSPLFNSGKGAVLTELGDVELDASIMDGKNINAGGVAGIKHIKNPITLARFVM
ncbi:MAG: isoaspartyl peptidase/L-asparaginase, partial [Arcobacter sp.]|nr:isoaspartyl peptidase/L-asparaginase [Arcobacter sp.]